MTIETERLRLLPWQEEDWVSFAPIARDPDVMRFITGGEPWTDEQIRDFVARQQALYFEHGFCRWRLELKETGETVGFCGGGNVHGFEEFELGWWIARAHWGKGLATEAARAALEDLFQRLGLERVISVIAVGNNASVRVAEKLGYRFSRDAKWGERPVRVFERLR